MNGLSGAKPRREVTVTIGDSVQAQGMPRESVSIDSWRRDSVLNGRPALNVSPTLNRNPVEEARLDAEHDARVSDLDNHPKLHSRRNNQGGPVNVRHKGTPAEPFAQQGMLGRITATDSGYRITPAHRGIPALAHCQWTHEVHGDFCTWEVLHDLQIQRAKQKDKKDS